ncbi:MAG TPA: ASCH domain-containing protein [Archaeoglobus veneficus]|nr:ASCH domain-containing protein [Archaeoglobus veneficus]
MNESNFKIEKHLEFKDKFKSKILNGKKTTTLRIYTNLKEGDLVYIHCGGNVIGIAEIESVMQKLLKDLNNEDAKLNGFKSKDELLEELEKFYGKLPEKIFIIKFKLKSKLNEEPYKIYYGNTSLAEIAEKALKHLDLDEKDRKILELFLKLKSVRKVAFKLGGLKKRGIVRRVLRNSYRKLKQKGLI